MPIVFVDPVCTTVDNEATIEWTMRNSRNDEKFENKDVKFIDSTPACLWDKKWYIRIYPSDQVSTFRMFLRRQHSANINLGTEQNISYKFRITNYNLDKLYFETEDQECLFSKLVNTTYRFDIPREYHLNLGNVFRKKTTVKIFCFVKLLNTPNSEASLQPRKSSNQNVYAQNRKEDLSTFAMSKGIDKLAHNLKNLLLTGKDSDVTLDVKGKKFSVHKLILKCQSSVFDSMFDHDMLEKTSGVVEITDCNPDVFNEFLLYLYSGEMPELTCNSAVDFHYISHKYDVTELTTACVQFMIDNFSVESFCDFIWVGLQYEDIALIESANSFLAHNFKQVFLTEKWKKFLLENPSEGYTLMSTALNKNEMLPVDQ